MRREHDFPQPAGKDERAERRGDCLVQRREEGETRVHIGNPGSIQTAYQALKAAVVLIGVQIPFIAILSVGPVILILPGLSEAYEEDVHFFLTLFLADVAGFPFAEATALARYDQATDDDPATTPLPTRSDPLAISHRALYHFVNAARFVAVEEAALQACDVKPIGQYLHVVEDFYAHRNYEPVLGHLLSGHAPDKPYLDPETATTMAGQKFSVLVRLAEACRSTTAPRARWKEISVRVKAFLSARPPDPRTGANWNTDRDRLKMLIRSEGLSSYEQAWEDYNKWKRQQGW
jgi:hypothetical protein